MCGLVGVAGTIYNQEKKIFRSLLELDARRGPHSTGVAQVKESNDIKVFKALGRPWHLYAETDGFDNEDVIKDWNLKTLIGHNRFATVGKKIPENAHPFWHDHIVGAHNGTLSREWLHKLEGHDKFDVDSEAIFYSMSKKGMRDTVATMHGAWALTWFDTATQTMNFLRNTQRPLHYVWSSDGLSFFWASEPWMLTVSLDEANVKHGKIEEFAPNEHHYLELKGNKGLRGKQLMYVKEPVKGFTQPVAKHQGSNIFGTAGKETGGTSGPNTSTQFVPENARFRAPAKGTAATTPDARAELQETVAKRLTDKFIQLEVIGEAKSDFDLRYLMCESPAVPEIFEIRLYGHGNPNYEGWLKSGGYFLAKVRNVNVNWNAVKSKWERYVTLDPRTMSEEYFIQKTQKEIDDITNAPPATTEVIVVEKKADVIPFKPRPSVDQILNRIQGDLNKQAESNQILVGALEFDPSKIYTGYKDQPLTFSQFMQSVKTGCSECGQNPAPGEEETIVWVGPKQFICQICDHRHRTENALKRNQK